jgi:hypothetical protein
MPGAPWARAANAHPRALKAATQPRRLTALRSSNSNKGPTRHGMRTARARHIALRRPRHARERGAARLCLANGHGRGPRTRARARARARTRTRTRTRTRIMGSGTRHLPPQNPPNGFRHEAPAPSKSPEWVPARGACPLKIPRMGSGTRRLPPQNPPNGSVHEAPSASKSPEWVGTRGAFCLKIPRMGRYTRLTAVPRSRNGSSHAVTGRAVALNGSSHAVSRHRERLQAACADLFGASLTITSSFVGELADKGCGRTLPAHRPDRLWF